METEAEEKLLFILKKKNKKHRIKQLFDGIRMEKKIAFPSDFSFRFFFFERKKESKVEKKKN